MSSEIMSSDILSKLPETDPCFVNERDAIELHASSPVQHDPDRLIYFENYAAVNFNSSLTPGFGTEDILDLLASAPADIDWLDLGAGTTSLFWTAALAQCKSVTAVDIFPEALEILQRVVAQGDVSDCTADALARFDRGQSHIAVAQALHWRYLVFDFAQHWPEHLNLQRYDLVTAFGCFGLGPEAPEHFKASMANTRPHLSSRGQIVGANWLRTESSIANEGYDTSFLTRNFLAEQCKQNGLELKFSHMVAFDDDRFLGVLIWQAAVENI